MIYADENVWLPVVEGLRRRGWDVTAARDENTIGHEDEKHLRYAAERGWMVRTFDDDFLGLVETKFADRVDSALRRNAERDLMNEVLYA